MATNTIAGINVSLTAESAAFIREINKASAATAAAANKMQQSTARMESSFVRTGRAVTQFANTFKSLFAAQLILQGTSALMRYSDAWQEATNKIAAAAQISGKQAASMDELIKASIETRSSIEDVTDTYAKLLRTTAAVPEAQGRVVQMTRTVVEAFKAGGAATLEQVNAIRQLGQALGSGVLQGDELRSVRENAPLIAKAIADEFGTTVAGLKQLGAEGKLTSDRVTKAIIDNQAKIHDAFLATKPTFQDAWNVLNTGITAFVGRVNEATGASETLFGWIVKFVDKINSLDERKLNLLRLAFNPRLPGLLMALPPPALPSLDFNAMNQQLGTAADQMNVYKNTLAAAAEEEKRFAFLADMANRQLDLRKSLAKEIQSPLEEYRAKLQDIAAAQVGVAETTELTRVAQLNLAAAYLDAVGQATGALASAFKENKAFQIANVVVNTAAAIVKALADPKIPWPLDLAVAASMAVAGAAQIATIASTEMGSSKSISKPSSGGATAAAGAASTSGGGRPAPAQVVTINIEGDIFGPEHFRKIVAGINGVQKDGTALLRIS